MSYVSHGDITAYLLRHFDYVDTYRNWTSLHRKDPERSSVAPPMGCVQSQSERVHGMMYQNRPEKLSNRLNRDNVNVVVVDDKTNITSTEFAAASAAGNEYPYKPCNLCRQSRKRSLRRVIEGGSRRRQDQNNWPSSGAQCTITVALNALDLTVPASDALLKNRKNAWVQLAGHPGSFAPAGPHTVWKRRIAKENSETAAYQSLMNDVLRDVVPRFYREVEYNSDFFIEMEDLLQHFTDPFIMDIKLGTRTFLESEVKNPVLRKDLYDKMIKLDPSEPTDEEHNQAAITKLRYMQFREKGSSTSTLGFRIEAIKMSGQVPTTDLKKIKTEDQVARTLARFLEGNTKVQMKLLKRCQLIRKKFEMSKYFKTHEVIGSSLLFLYDRTNAANVWMIDFAKVLPLDEGQYVTHRVPWKLGNHEDGYLTGLDSIIRMLSNPDLSKCGKESSSRRSNADLLIHDLHTNLDQCSINNVDAT